MYTSLINSEITVKTLNLLFKIYFVILAKNKYK